MDIYFISKLKDISSATRAVTDIAGTLLSCVYATFLSFSSTPVSCKFCGICGVVPKPVSPSTIKNLRTKIVLLLLHLTKS